MAYEIYMRTPDILSERLFEVLIERNLPFAEIQVGDGVEADALERKHGRSMPFVMVNGRVIGGFSDLVLFLRQPARRAVRAVPA